jgi:ABC-type branched-subunit amino acid transport system ATPase component
MDAILEVLDVSLTIGSLPILTSVDMTVRRGQIHGIIGPNGAGKTTLFNVLSGFMRVDTGDVRWKGQSITRWKPEVIARAGIVRTFQTSGGARGLTVGENIRAAAGRGNEARCREVCELMELEGSWHRPLEDCGAAIDRLVGLCMALTRQPELLLLDEPLAGLDYEERRRVVRAVRAAHETGATVCIVEHDIQTVLELADEILILEAGRQVAAGPPTELASNELLKAFT